MKYLSSLIVSALLFLLLSVLFSVQVLPLYGSVLISFLASALLTSVVAIVIAIIVLSVFAAVFYAIGGETWAAISILFSLVVMYVAQFNIMQYFGNKFAWYPSFSDGQLILYFAASLILGLLLGASNKKNWYLTTWQHCDTIQLKGLKVPLAAYDTAILHNATFL